MRFRSKLTYFFWITLANAALSTGDVVFSHHRTGDFVDFALASGWGYLALAAIANQCFSYWELHPDGLLERRLWHTRTIPFEQMTRIAPDTAGERTRPGWLSVDFHRDPPMSESGTLLLAPAHPDQIIDALRRAAPQATFITP